VWVKCEPGESEKERGRVIQSSAGGGGGVVYNLFVSSVHAKVDLKHRS